MRYDEFREAAAKLDAIYGGTWTPVPPPPRWRFIKRRRWNRDLRGLYLNFMATHSKGDSE